MPISDHIYHDDQHNLLLHNVMQLHLDTNAGGALLPTAILIVSGVFFWARKTTRHGKITRAKSTQWLLRRCDFAAGHASQQQTSREEDH